MNCSRAMVATLALLCGTAQTALAAVPPANSPPSQTSVPSLERPLKPRPPVGSDQPVGARIYVSKADVTRVAPPVLVPGQPFMVDLYVAVESSISQEWLTSQLRVYVDAIDASATTQATAASPEPRSDNAASPSGAGSSERLSKFFALTLFARVPDTLPLATSHEVSVFSVPDGRTIAAAKIEVAAPQTVATDTPSTLAALLNSPGGMVLASLLVISVATTISLWLRRSKRSQAVIDERTPERAAVGGTTGGREALAVRTDSNAAAPVPTPIPASPRPPQLPDQLLHVAEQGQLTVVIGPGVSAQSGLPTGVALLTAVSDACAHNLPPQQLASLRGLLADGNSDAVLDALISLVGRQEVITALASQLLKPSAKPSRLHRELAQLPARVFIDMTWDELAIEALDVETSDVFGPQRPDGFSSGYRSQQVQVIKPRGSVRDPKTIVLTDLELRRQLSRLPELQRSIAALFSSQSLLFVGMSLRDIAQFLTTLLPEIGALEPRHFALLAIESGADLWQAGLGVQFGLQLVDFQPSPDFHELPDAIAAINAHVRRSRAAGGTGITEASSRIRYVEMRGIGVFRSLRLDVAEGWTLLLGNNGGGKSTILRAIALTLAGNDPRLAAAAPRLLRSSEKEGTIEVGIGATPIRTNLLRDGPTVVVRSPQTTPLQAGQMLVLAFPALRGVTTVQPQGPTSGDALNPSVDDVLPLLTGVVDTRLNDLKQWVVNTVLRSEKGSGGREKQMLATFRELIQEMVPGGKIEFSNLDRKDWTIYLKTEDGDVPFDSVSQGMSSILNWVGVLLQRLYDVYPKSAAPEREAALVLVDEIDAHLHPRWQRQLVALARKHFPNVQFIASSHSPLLAGAVANNELRIVERDPDTGEMKADPPRENLSGQKAEDILTSSLFSLHTTRSPEAEQVIKSYFALFEKPSLTPEEERQLAELAEQLEQLNYGPTRGGKQRNQELRARLDAQLQSLTAKDFAGIKSLLQPSDALAEKSQLTGKDHAS